VRAAQHRLTPVVSGADGAQADAMALIQLSAGAIGAQDCEASDACGRMFRTVVSAATAMAGLLRGRGAVQSANIGR